MRRATAPDGARARRPWTITARLTLLIVTGALLAAPSFRPASGESTTLVHPPFGHCLGMHKVTSFHAFVYLGTRTRFDEPAGIAAVKLRLEDDPETTSDDDELTVFGLNSGRCEIIYNRSLYEVDIYGSCGGGAGQFREPLGIAADELGNVFVADTGNHRIVRLLYNEDGLKHVRSFGSIGGGPGQFEKPSQISIGHSGRLFVTDTGNDRVVVMTSMGEPVSQMRGDAAAGVVLSEPFGVAAVESEDPWISRGQEFVVVSDAGGSRLVKFSTDGRVLATASADTLASPEPVFGALAIDYYGNVYAVDRPNGRIHKFDRDLRHVTAFGRTGGGDGEFDDPRGITLWRRFGQIFVTERAGAQYYWIGTEIRDLGVSRDAFAPSAGERLALSYYLTETSRVTIELLDDDGELVHTLVDDRRRAIGHNSERWDGRLGRHGRTVAPGDYALRLTARPTYSSRQYFQDTAITHVSVLEGPSE